MTVAADLALIEARLHDDNAVWPRAELLRLYNDAYRQLLAQAQAVRRWRPTDLPGRHTFGITQEWEAASASRGTVRKPTHAMLAEAYQGTSLWEIEAVEGITPTTSLGGHTQEWERAYRSGDSDLHFRFSFPRNHERVVRLEWQNRKLHPVGVRELDDSDSRWYAQIGEPRWWTTGTGRVRSVELYEIATAYLQTYALPTTPEGIAREFAGSRTWAVEVPIEHPTSYAYTSSADVPTLLSGLGSRVTRRASASGYLGEVLADLPLVYWRLGESSGTVAAAARGDTAGTYSGSPTLGQTGLVTGDTAVRFDGVNDYVDVTGTAVTLSANGATAWSVECWVQTTATPVTGVPLFFVAKPKSAFYAYALYLDAQAPGKLIAAFGLPGTAILATSLTTVNDGLPHHIVATRDAAGVTIYVDGRLDATAASAAAISDDDNFSVRIGALGPEFAGIEGYVAATIDEVALYTSALSPVRVAAHYAAGVGATTTPVYAIHVWEEEFLEGETTFTASVTIGTYTWEHQFGAERLVLAVGQARSVSSTARQYLPVTSDATLGTLLGHIVDWRSSEDAVFALEVVVPDAELVAADTPDLIPSQMTKYLRFYVLSRAFGRPGEGRQPILADFYGRRFQRGVDLFRAMGDVARTDRTFQRQETVPSRTRPPYVRLPATFPSVWT